MIEILEEELIYYENESDSEESEEVEENLEEPVPDMLRRPS